jgi:hypothetical protein
MATILDRFDVGVLARRKRMGAYRRAGTRRILLMGLLEDWLAADGAVTEFHDEDGRTLALPRQAMYYDSHAA